MTSEEKYFEIARRMNAEAARIRVDREEQEIPLPNPPYSFCCEIPEAVFDGWLCYDLRACSACSRIHPFPETKETIDSYRSKRGYRAKGLPKGGSTLTASKDPEVVVLDALRDAWSFFSRLPKEGSHPSDEQDVADAFHSVQRIMFARMLSRLRPDLFENSPRGAKCHDR